MTLRVHVGPQSGKWFWKLLGLGIAFVSKETKKKLLGIAKTTIRSLTMPSWALLGYRDPNFLIKESYMSDTLNKVYLRFFLQMGVIFRDESNDDN